MSSLSNSTTTADHPTPDQVKAYYDVFSAERMLNYRLVGNRRIEKAIHFFTDSLRRDETVLDIGCGIGIATEAMARRTSGRVVGVDISEQNIWYAKKTINLPNLDFVVQDVLSETFDAVILLGHRPSTITMCDVIEHIPEASRPELFKKFASIGSADLKVQLTFPTAVHLEYLEQEEPAEIQIIDNKLPPQVLGSDAAQAGFAMTYFKMIDVWRGADYAHCTFERLDSLRSRIRVRVSDSLVERCRSRVARAIARRAKKRRYIDNIFSTK